MILSFFILGTIFIASVSQGLLGFGFSLVALPLLVLKLSPKEAIPLCIFTSTFLSLYLVFSLRKHIVFGNIKHIMISGILGIPLGTFLLKMSSDSALKIIIGSAVFISAFSMLFGLHFKFKKNRLVEYIIGFSSGTIAASIGSSSPPIVLFYANQNIPPKEFKANLNLYFSILTLILIPLELEQNILNLDLIRTGIYSIPVVLAGSILGLSLSKKIKDSFFRKLTLSFLILSGLSLILSSLL